jgi:DNA-binding winged helix-turn-helix (wHTH) protein/Tfp pilus assembly protein PilF
MDASANGAALAFGPYVLSLRPLSLQREGERVTLRPQALRLLALLAERSHALVTQEEIRERLWGDRHVDFARGIHLLVREIRQALADDAEKPLYIETLPRQGYRFIADARRIDSSLAVSTKAKPLAWKPALVAAALLVVAVPAALILVSSNASMRAADSSPAREAYLKGEYLLGKGGERDLDASAEHFKEAIALDPDYAPAHAGLAEVAVHEGDFPAAERHAQKALDADANSAEAYLNLGMIAALRDWNWREAERLVDKSIRLDPELAKAHAARAMLMTILGRRDEALAATGRAHELDPVSALIKTDHGWFHYYAGDFSGAIQYCGEAAGLAPENYGIAYCELKAAAAAGDIAKEAEAAARILRFWKAEDALARELAERPSREALSRFYAWRTAMLEDYVAKGEAPADALAAAYAAAGDFDAAAAMLEKSLHDRASLLPLALRDPVFRPLHADARFARLLVRAGVDAPPAM